MPRPLLPLGLGAGIELGLDLGRKINWSLVLALTCNFGVWLLVAAAWLSAVQ